MPTVRSNIRIDAYDLLGRAVAHERETELYPSAHPVGRDSSSPVFSVARRPRRPDLTCPAALRRRLISAFLSDAVLWIASGNRSSVVCTPPCLDSDAGFGRCVTDDVPQTLASGRIRTVEFQFQFFRGRLLLLRLERLRFKTTVSDARNG